MVCWQISTVTAPAVVPVVMKRPMHQTRPVTVTFPAANANPNTAVTGSFQICYLYYWKQIHVWKMADTGKSKMSLGVTSSCWENYIWFLWTAFPQFDLHTTGNLKISIFCIFIVFSDYNTWSHLFMIHLLTVDLVSKYVQATECGLFRYSCEPAVSCEG